MIWPLITSPFIYKESWKKLSNKIKPYWSIGNLNYILSIPWNKQKHGFMEKVRLRTRTLYLLDFVLLFINLRSYVGTLMQQNNVFSYVCHRFISSISFVHQKFIYKFNNIWLFFSAQIIFIIYNEKIELISSELFWWVVHCRYWLIENINSKVSISVLYLKRYFT
jgi:hypothetical protein